MACHTITDIAHEHDNDAALVLLRALCQQQYTHRIRWSVRMMKLTLLVQRVQQAHQENISNGKNCNRNYYGRTKYFGSIQLVSDSEFALNTLFKWVHEASTAASEIQYRRKHKYEMK